MHSLSFLGKSVWGRAGSAIRSLTLYSKRTSVSYIDQGRSYQICSDIPSCVCIQPLVDFLRGSSGYSFGFPEWYQALLGYAHIQPLFLIPHSFRPSFDQDHSWVSTPLSFQLTIWLSSTAPSFNTQIVHYRCGTCKCPHSSHSVVMWRWSCLLW